MTSAELFRWLNTARRGASAVYHTGFLCDDRKRSGAVQAVADTAWQAHLGGIAFLTQRRLADRLYDYLITKGASV